MIKKNHCVKCKNEKYCPDANKIGWCPNHQPVNKEKKSRGQYCKGVVRVGNYRDIQKHTGRERCFPGR